jgi:hypothetical protein
MPKFKDPADVYTEGRFLSGESDPFNPQQPKKKTKKKKKPSACGQGSCSSDNIRSYK